MPRSKTRISDLDNLSRTQLQRFNDAFDQAAREAYRQKHGREGPSPAKKRKVEAAVSEENGGGGFIADPDDGDNAGGGGGGGFMPDLVDLSRSKQQALQEEEEDIGQGYDRIPLSYVASILDQLGLPSDAEVLGTFQHVIDSEDEDEDSSASDNGIARPGPKDAISRDHFLQVCAVLVGDDESSDDNARKTKYGGKKTHKTSKQNAEEASDLSEPSDSSADEDAYEVDKDSDAEMTSSRARKPVTRASRSKAKSDLDTSAQAIFEDDTELTDIEEDEEGITAVATKTKGARAASGKSKGKAKTPVKNRELTADQKRSVENTFQEFFPSSGNHTKSQSQSIGLEEIRYVASLINYSLTDGEINEMLEQASTGSKMRVSLSDFEQVMRKCVSLS